MIEEPGRVVAVEAGTVWVETVRSGSCSSCAASATCGSGLMDKLGIHQRHMRMQATTDLQLQVGDPVVIGIPEELLLGSALQVYLLPLIGLFAGILWADAQKFGELAVVAAGLSCMILVWLGVRQYQRRRGDTPDVRPRVLRAGVPLCNVPADRV